MEHDSEELRDVLTNRQKSQIASKHKKFFCRACDAQIVGQWGKCPNCGHKNTKKIRNN